MRSFRRVSVVAATGLLLCVVLVGCGNSTPAAIPHASASAVASPATTFAAPTPTLTPATASPAASAQATTAPIPSASNGASHAPITTPVPGSSLDPSLSDAGIVGRLTIPDDTRNGWSGTHQIIGLEADSSNCSYSLDGNEFTAVAWYDAAPNGMLHQMAVTISTDYVPSNDGEQRAGISDGSVYADFVSDSGFGTAYGGATSKGDSSSSSIDAKRIGDTLVFTFTGTTWDGIDFSGQLMCSGMGS